MHTAAVFSAGTHTVVGAARAGAPLQQLHRWPHLVVGGGRRRAGQRIPRAPPSLIVRQRGEFNTWGSAHVGLVRQFVHVEQFVHVGQFVNVEQFGRVGQFAQFGYVGQLGGGGYVGQGNRAGLCLWGRLSMWGALSLWGVLERAQ
eukprot:365980-Chlamydomonas_euryale.AAC.4